MRSRPSAILGPTRPGALFGPTKHLSRDSPCERCPTSYYVSIHHLTCPLAFSVYHTSPPTIPRKHSILMSSSALPFSTYPASAFCLASIPARLPEGHGPVEVASPSQRCLTEPVLNAMHYATNPSSAFPFFHTPFPSVIGPSSAKSRHDIATLGSVQTAHGGDMTWIEGQRYFNDTAVFGSSQNVYGGNPYFSYVPGFNYAASPLSFHTPPTYDALPQGAYANAVCTPPIQHFSLAHATDISPTLPPLSGDSNPYEASFMVAGAPPNTFASAFSPLSTNNVCFSHYRVVRCLTAYHADRTRDMRI